MGVREAGGGGVRVSRFHDLALKEAVCTIERFEGETAQKQKVTVKLHPGENDIFMTRISTENRELRKKLEKEAKVEGVQYKVISSKRDVEGPQKAEALFIVRMDDYQKHGPELEKLVQEIEHTPISESSASLFRENRVTLFLTEEDMGHPVEVAIFTFSAENQEAVKRFSKTKYPDYRVFYKTEDPDTAERIYFLIPSYISQSDSQKLIPQIVALFDEEGAPAERGHFLMLEEAKGTRYIDLADKQKLAGKGGSATVYAKDTFFERRVPQGKEAKFEKGFIASTEGRTAEEVLAVDQLWAKLKGIVGEDNVSIIVGLQPPYLRTEPELMSTYYPADLRTTQNFGIDEPMLQQYALQLIQALFWMQMAQSLNLDLKEENVLVGEEGVIVIDHPAAPLTWQVTTKEEAKQVERYLQRLTATAEMIDFRIYSNIIRLSTTPPRESDEDLINRVNTALAFVPNLQMFEMGVLLFSLFTSKPPYPTKEESVGETTDFDKAVKISQSALMGELVGNCPKDMATLICKMVAVDPGLRPTLAELIAFIKKNNPAFARFIERRQRDED